MADGHGHGHGHGQGSSYHGAVRFSVCRGNRKKPSKRP